MEQITIANLDEIAEELFWKGNLAKKLPRFAEDDELNDFLLNQRLDEEWEIYQYTHR
jgi:hypothetical protein